MCNVVIASKDALCQSAKNWFVTKKGYEEGLESFSNLGDGKQLIIIAHDNELADGNGLIAELQKQAFPMTDFKVILVVCSAAALNDFTTGVVTPAENLANYFKRSVFASTDIVVGQWDDSGAQFKGNYKEVKPGEDIISKLEGLDLNDKK
ncbi:MAG: hypothetical protein AAGC45_05565 [Bacteroidota bacterium]